MHIGVDGSFWGGRERCVAVATRRLWTSYLERTPARRVTVFAQGVHASAMPNASLVPVGPLTPVSRFAWQQVVLPALVREQGVELLHCPCYTAPLALSCKFIVTVHDLIARTHPRLAGWRNALHFRLLLGRGIRRARAVCVPTDSVRRSVIEQFGASPGKVFVVPWGVDLEIAPSPRDVAASTVRQSFDVDEPFMLFCSCVEPKKNLQVAIRACAEAGLLLLIVGPSVSASRRILSQGGRASGGRWRYLGYATPSDLSALYSAATALVFPSYTEGFGLPAVEAMSCGCPVIASDAPALREVCGGAALHVPPWDVSALAAALRAVATDRALRDSLVARGIARSRQFNWANAVDSFSEALGYAERSTS
jgi:glycosyltransferase involved in cell wall biosynthesis